MILIEGRIWWRGFRVLACFTFSLCPSLPACLSPFLSLFLLSCLPPFLFSFFILMSKLNSTKTLYGNPMCKFLHESPNVEVSLTDELHSLQCIYHDFHFLYFMKLMMILKSLLASKRWLLPQLNLFSVKGLAENTALIDRPTNLST